MQTEAPGRYKLNEKKIKVSLYVEQEYPHHTNKKRPRAHEESNPQPKTEPKKSEVQIVREPTPGVKQKKPEVPATVLPVAPDPIVYRDLAKKQEEIKSPSNTVEVVSKEDSSETLIKSYVKRLPKT